MPKGIYKHKPLSKSVKEKLSKSLSGRKRPSFSKEWKKKMSDAHKGMKKPWVSKLMKGKKLSKETKTKMSKTQTGMKRKPFTKKARDNMSEGGKGKKFSREHRRKISESHKGEMCNFWKGGITPKNLRIRTSIEYRLWRESVFARDNYTCQKTVIRGCKLHAHHIKNFAQWPELRFAIDNGITFSKKAHNEFHRIYGKKNNNEKQINEFIGSKSSNVVQNDNIENIFKWIWSRWDLDLRNLDRSIEHYKKGIPNE